jgi:hypothetical protein
MKNNDNELSAADARALNITETILGMVHEAVIEKLAQCEQSAADVAEDSDQDDGKPIMAKLTLAIKWPAGAQSPKIELEATHSVRRSLSFSAIADGTQAKLNLSE